MLLNDGFHPDGVCGDRFLNAFFRAERTPSAFESMLTVHKKGAAVVGVV